MSRNAQNNRQEAAKVRSKIASLVKFAETNASEKQKVMIRRFLATINQSGTPTLEEVERQVHEIYGDQSDNSTYYFSRRNRLKGAGVHSESGRPWGLMSLDEVEAEVDDIYGDQSLNETFYTSRNKGASLARKAQESADRPLAEVQREVHETYGDQSDNSTYYFGRKHLASYTTQENNIQHETGFEYFSEDDVDAYGYDRGDIMQMPDVVQDRDEAVGILQGIESGIPLTASDKRELLRLGHENPTLRSHILKVLGK